MNVKMKEFNVSIIQNSLRKTLMKYSKSNGLNIFVLCDGDEMFYSQYTRNMFYFAIYDGDSSKISHLPFIRHFYEAAIDRFYLYSTLCFCDINII